MQFGHALDRILREILLADPTLGPIYLIKLDISDGFYRIALNIDDIPKLGVAFPPLPGHEPLIAFPLVLPMGWTNSPPIFSTATETIADLANARLQQPGVPPPHHLDTLAESIPSPAPAAPTNMSSLPPVVRDPSLPRSTRPLSYTDVFVDDWHRLKTRIGTIKVNATLSRKAQAEFGKYWSHLGRSVSFAPWHRVDPSKTVREEAFWESAYREKRDGWEMREVTPVLKSELPKLLKKIPMQNELCVVPGCGRGHDAEWIAQNSQMKVVGVDFAESAEREFEKFYPGSRASFQRADVFDYLGSIPEKASLIIEHTLFCAIDPALRKKYLEKVFGALKKGGMLAGVFWMRPNPDGPPFGFTPWELRELLSPFSVDVLDWHLSFDSWEGRRGQEYFVVLQKK
jgi:SAM-dependent methyltransferase